MTLKTGQPTSPYATETVWDGGLSGTGVCDAGMLSVGRDSGGWSPEHLLLFAGPALTGYSLPQCPISSRRSGFEIPGEERLSALQRWALVAFWLLFASSRAVGGHRRKRSSRRDWPPGPL